MWPESTETQELLQQAGAGRPQAVNALLERHREALRRMVDLRMDRALARRIDASDVVQDVMLEASQRIEAYLQDPRLPFHLWLRHLAQDQLIDLHRRHRVAQRRSLDREQPLARAGDGNLSSVDLAGMLSDHQITPAAALLRKELEQRFLVAIDQLDAADRDIILMRHFEHLTNSEVAQALGLTQPAAGMRYLRALRRLRSILGDSPSLASPTE